MRGYRSAQPHRRLQPKQKEKLMAKVTLELGADDKAATLSVINLDGNEVEGEGKTVDIEPGHSGSVTVDLANDENVNISVEE